LDYIGSTSSKNRFHDHDIIRLFGFDNINIIILLEIICNDKEAILKLEQQYINNLKPNLNLQNPHPQTAIKYIKKDIITELEKYSLINKFSKDDNEIKLYPKNIIKYAGGISKVKNRFRLRIQDDDFKCDLRFGSLIEAENKQREISIKRNLVYNCYYLKYDKERKENYYEIELNYRNTIIRTKVSIESIDIIENHNFFMGDGYVVMKINNFHKKLHHLLCQRNENESIDHINRDKLDNRLFNLRSATQETQTRNRGIKRNNTSGFNGVYCHKSHNCYVSSIYFNKIKIQKDFSVVKYGNYAKLHAICNRNNLEMLYGYKKWNKNDFLFVDENFNVI